MAIFLLCCCLLLQWHLVFASEPDSISDEFINLINKEQSYWKAERTFPKSMPLRDIKRLLGARGDAHTLQLEKKAHDSELIANLPESFDPRDKWPNCRALNDIRDQGACGSCWTHAAVEAITDRYCTCSNGTKHFYFSIEDVLTCSGCGGCNGGYPHCVYRYWQDNGIVSGGPYNSRQGCRPYEIPPCKLHKQGLPCEPEDFVPTPKCVKSCIKEYGKRYQDDLQFASSVYTLEEEDNIRADLYLNGPVTVVMKVCKDFITYKSGVYKHTRGEYLGGHAVKLIGWGVDRGLKYWLAANSWNVEWGEKGFFRILRAEDYNCGFLPGAIAGIPHHIN